MAESRLTRRNILGLTVGSVVGVRTVRSTETQPGGIRGANEQLNLGLIGAGNRAETLIAWAEKLYKSDNVILTAVCDIWSQRRESAVRRIAQNTPAPPRSCRTPAELCELKDIDAVLIATPDFQHPVHTRLAVEAGKDVYVEKPFGCDFEQIKAARDVVKRSDRIMQHGTQERAKGVIWAAQDYLQSGKLGKINYVEMSQPLFQQRWRIPGAEKSITAEDTDWSEFLCYTPAVPFNPRFYREFRLFWPYSTGIFCQWMSHMIDLVNWLLGERPKAVTAAGGIYVWPDGRNTPDTAQCLIEYPGGCLASYHMRMGNSAAARPLLIHGTNGTLDLFSGVAYGDGGGGEVLLKNPGAANPEFVVDAARRLPDRSKGGVILTAPPDGDHLSDFFSAVRTRKPPRAPIDAAFNQALATTMAGMSYRMGRRIQYDPVADNVSPGEKETAAPPSTQESPG
ncbi:MAG TPA: Gfo/Idh/MocA family oxidoreductase [Phycisphaerae bacterium]|nr:Gfo/Idh/MocA family oxidoreductase [Phycisphaerae bacterium]